MTKNTLVPLSWIVPVKETRTIRNGFLKLKGTPRPVLNNNDEILFRKCDLLKYFNVTEDNMECLKLYDFQEKYGVSTYRLNEMIQYGGLRAFYFHPKRIRGSYVLIFTKHYYDCIDRFVVEYNLPSKKYGINSLVNKIISKEFITRFNLSDKDVELFKRHLNGDSIAAISSDLKITGATVSAHYTRIINIIGNSLNNYIKYQEQRYEVDLLKRELHYYKEQYSKLLRQPIGSLDPDLVNSPDLRPIKGLPLSVRSISALSSCGFVHAQDVKDFGILNLFKVRNLGKKSVMEIEDLLFKSQEPESHVPQPLA
jgi:DNA-binding CsgD family transcriptional regulator